MFRLSVLLGLAALTVGCNTPPEGGAISIAPEAPQTLDALVLSVDEDAVDPNGHAITYEITWIRNGIEETAVAGAIQVPADLTTRDEIWQVRVVPVDEKGEPGPELTASTTIENTAPTAAVELSTRETRTGEALTATATTADADADAVEVTWTWTRDGSSTEYASDSVPEGVTARGEVWVAQATPTDGDDVGEPAEASIVIDNALPVAVRVSLSPASPSKQGPVTATPTGFDDDGDTVSWSYTWFVNGAAVPDQDGPVLDTEFFAKGATLSVEALPNDGFVDGDPVSSEELVVVNTPPSADSATISPAEIRAGVNATCELEGWSDLDGDPESFSVAWTVNGRDAGTETTLLASEFRRDDVLQCTVTPNDGTDDGDPVQSDLLTVANTAPVLVSAGLSPSDPKEADTISVSLTGASDADGDAISYRYAWEVNGSTISSVAASLTGSSFSKDDSVVAIVTPTDGDADGAPVRTAAVTVVNTAPVVSAVTLSPSSLTTTTPVTATPTATDADGDSVTYTYTWYRQDEGAGSFARLSSTGRTLSASSYDKDDVVYVGVVGSDGEDSSAEVTSTRLTIQNTAPVAPTIVLTPEDPVEGVDDLLCEVDTPSTDVDGNPLTYRVRWELDGTSWTGATFTDTIPKDGIDAAETSAEDDWQCFVVANDGTADSAEASSTVETVVPGTTVYNIPRSQLVNQASTCSSTAYDSVYNGCSGNWGFTWTDVGSTSPTAVTVEMYGGVYCSSSTSKAPTLNGSSTGTTFAMTGGRCDCNPTKTVKTFSLADLRGYRAGTTNSLSIPNGGSCEGLSVNSSWGSGIYARVTVRY